MKQLTSSAKCFIRAEAGATTVEYGLLIGLLSLVAVASIVGAARFLNGAFEKVQTEMANGGIPSK
jgi:Flp pilus assembly pilin Flp